MDIYASDEEKGEEIKRWWLENGRSVILGCALGGMIIFGGRYWMDSREALSENASATYQQVSQALLTQNSTAADELTQTLLSDFSKTPYAVFAALEMAAQANEENDSETAMIYLKWVSDNATLPGHVEIARLRQAKILIDDAKFEEALALINQSNSISFASLISEMKGDISVALQNRDGARLEYKQAMADLTQSDPRLVLLQIKLDDLAIENEG